MKKTIRDDFPILKQTVAGNQLIYFDSAATSQRPDQVIDAVASFYRTDNANIHRGIHTLSERATQAYEDAREKVASFIGARPEELVFVRGATEGINLIAQAWGEQAIGPGDEIVVSELEHHANLLPWQRLAQKTGAKLRFIPITPEGSLVMDALDELITPRTKLVAVTHESNMVGTAVDVATVAKKAHAVGARILVDACQSVPHQPVDVRELGCDFLAFSGHKMLGPTGIGGLYIRHDLHEHIEPYQVGGGIVQEVDFHDASWQNIPQKLEAGTPAIAQAVGLGVAVDYIREHIDFDALQVHEATLVQRAIEGLETVPGVTVIGPKKELSERGHLVSFVVDGYHAHDVAEYLNTFGIAVRAGHHCAQPLAKKLGIPASVRASFYCYNMLEEVECFIQAMQAIHDE